MKPLALILALLLVVLLATSAFAGGGGIWMPRSVIGGGGGRVQSGDFVLHGTVGQMAVGSISNASYDLRSGFWFVPLSDAQYHVYLPLLMRQ